jgi:glycosyltransferase involved in cell wall biosynthesis
MTKLTVVIIARNEKTNLPKCLESIKWADEIIVGDCGSTDRTVEIARQAGAKIVTYEWQGYGIAKQTVAAQATGEWILSIDADEEVTEGLAQEIRTVVSDVSDQAGYRMPRLTLFLGRWIRHGGWYPDRVLRLYRRGCGRFTESSVHEALEVEGSIGTLQHDLLHYSYPTLEVYFDKFNRYTSLAAEEALRRGVRGSLGKILFNPAAKFLKQYVFRAGFLDGLEGLLLAILSAGYVLIKYAKLRQLERANRISK